MTNVLISIKPKYVDLILSGDKSVEIRNRPVKLQPETSLWIYSTLPRGCLEAVAEVHAIELDAPSVIWNQYHNKIGASQHAFLTYVNGSRQISAIFLKNVRRLTPSLTLSDLRSEIEGFNPPQFLRRIGSASPFFSLLGSKKVRLTGLPTLHLSAMNDEKGTDCQAQASLVPDDSV